MSDEPITLTDRDSARLAEMVEEMRVRPDSDTAECLAMLEKELGRAEIIPSEQAPSKIVTMNSHIQFRDVDTGEKLVYTVTWPHLANMEEQKVSVLAPIGMALLGTCIGQIIEWKVPAGKRRFRLERILYQPEAEGDLDA